MSSNKKIQLTTQHVNALKDIAATVPGTILTDFAAFLEFVSDNKVEMGKNVMMAKYAALFNELLQQPVRLDLKRPLQRSYPHVNALFLLARTTQLVMVQKQGKKNYLVLNEAVLSSWQALTPVERWCELLDIWIMQTSAETVGEDKGTWFKTMFGMTGFDWLMRRMPEKGVTFSDMKKQKSHEFFYMGSIHIAAAELFGLLHVKHGKPEAGEGWRILSIKATILSYALYQLLNMAKIQDALIAGIFPILEDEEKNDKDVESYNTFKPFLENYVPEWQNQLEKLETEVIQAGQYIFKVTLGRAWRRFSVSDDVTWEAFADAILAAFDFDNEHLHCFEYKDHLNKSCRINHQYMEEPPFTFEVCISEINLVPGSELTFIFDFGDNWEFHVLLENIAEASPLGEDIQVIAQKGTPPEQYPDFDY